MVDDEVAVRGVTRRALEQSGYRVLVASEGTEALVVLAQHRTDVKAVVTDMMMPGMDGPALVRILRQTAPHLPIIGMTGVAERAVLKGLDGLDLPELLPKPFAIHVLVAALGRVLNATPESQL